jgi:hypothetical protein
MRARQYVISVGTSATAIEGSQYPGFRIFHNGTNDVFLGDANVTTADGFPLSADTEFSISELATKSLRGIQSDRLYGIVDAGTEEVRVIIEGRINV